ncbi:hypothetical protein EKL28_18265, partial [Staphylococcus aureus]
MRLLSQTISRQATEATASGTPEAMKKLTESQQSFAENLETVKSIHSNNEALQAVDKPFSIAFLVPTNLHKVWVNCVYFHKPFRVKQLKR